MRRDRALPRWAALLSLIIPAGCHNLARVTDQDVADAIAVRQRAALNYDRPAPLPPPEEIRAPRQAYHYVPQPTTIEPPPEFEAAAPTSMPAEAETGSLVDGVRVPGILHEMPERPPAKFRDQVFTLTDALAYAQQHRRELETAKEDLYLATLALTLERHLWTPQFAGNLRTIYGNFGEQENFNQAMRFVADLNMSQRLPYGGRFVAAAISTLIRDVRQSITASEGSEINLGLEVPLLRGAGHVAREDLIQLERELTYAVRTYEEFRRAQVVRIAQVYFDLLRQKQEVFDAENSLRNAIEDSERAIEIEKLRDGNPLDTARAQQRVLSEENRLAQSREAFRLATDNFKLLIGMPVEEGIGLDDLEDIEAIERQIASGDYPALREPPAVSDLNRAIAVALTRRLDLLNSADRIEDAKRGVDIARNALLPDLNWNSTLDFVTDPAHYQLANFGFDRANWRSEVVLSMDDRFREKNRYRASLIDVRRAERAHTDFEEEVRVDVRRAVNQIGLQNRLVEIQQKNVAVAAARREYAQIRWEDGTIGNRDKVEAEDEYVSALNDLNRAKTARWAALLEFRLSTGTLHVDETGAQAADSTLDGRAGG